MRFQFSLAMRYLLGRKLRAALTTLAIVIGVMVIFSMGSLLPTMLDAMQRSVLALSNQVDVTVVQRTSEQFSTSVLNRVKAVPGVAALTGSLSRQMNIPINFYGRNSTVSGLTLTGIDPRTAPEVHSYTTSQGRFLQAGDGNVAVINSSLADALSVKVGDTFRLPTPDGVVKLQVIGLRSGRPAFGNEEVLVTLTEAQKLLGASGQLSMVEANLDTKDPAQREAIFAQIQAQLGRNYSLNKLDSGSQVLASIGTAQTALNMLGVLSLFMGGFIIFNTFRTIVAERRHDIGMLRAIGANRRMIVGVVLAEGLIQGIAGTAIGLILGYLMGAAMTAGMANTFRQFLNIQVTGLVFQPGVFIMAIALGLGVTLVAGLLPAVRAGRVTPMEVLRPGVGEQAQPIHRGYTIAGAVMLVAAVAGLFSGAFAVVALGGLLFLVGLVLVGPALIRPVARIFSMLIAVIFAREGTGDLAQGNVTRQPSRSAITASATMIGLAIVVAAGGLMWSLNDSLLGVFRHTMASDFMLVPPSVAIWKGDLGATTSLANKLRSVPGVGAISSLRFAQSTIPTDAATGTGERDVSVLGIDPATYPLVSGMDFLKGTADQAYADLANGRTVIVNGILAAQAGLAPGQMLTLSTPTGQQDYKIAAIGGDVLDAKVATLYISQANLRTDFNKTEDIFIQMKLAPGANEAEVENRLRTVVENYPQFHFVATNEYIAEFSQQFDALFVGVYGLLALLSVPSLIAILNTLAIGVIERTREIGMLRAIGAARRQVRRMIIAEALLLAAIGTAFGLLGGLYLGYVMVQGLSASGIWRMTYSFPLASVLAAIAAGLIFGVLAALVPARQATRMQIIQALRYE